MKNTQRGGTIKVEPRPLVSSLSSLMSTAESNELAVFLRLSSGETFEDVPVTDLELKLGEFLDRALKGLEGECKISLPETDTDLIDTRDFRVFSLDKSEEFPLTCLLKNIPYVCRASMKDPPTLILESSIFRTAVEVDIDSRVQRRRGTLGTSRNHRPPHPPVRSISLGSKAMASEHMVFLAGRKEYDSSSQRIYGSTDLATMNEGGGSTLNLPEESLERVLSTSMSMSIDDAGSIHSYESQASEMSSQVDTIPRSLSLSGRKPPGGGVMNTLSVQDNIINQDKGVLPKLYIRHNTYDEEGEEIIFDDTPTINDNVLKDTTLPDVSLKRADIILPRKARKLASRRASNTLSSPASDEVALNLPSPLQGSFTRTTFRTKRIGSTVISPQHAKVYGNIKLFVVDFDIAEAHITVCMEDIRGDNTVAQIKQSLWKHLRDEGHIGGNECDFLWDPERFTLTYEMNSTVYELYDEQQIFQTTTVAQLWRQEKRQRGLLTVVMKKAESKEEKTLNMAISSMIGIGLYQLQFANNDELDITRRKMVTERRRAVQQRDPSLYCMETEVHFSTLPPRLKSMIGEDNKLLIRVYYESGAKQTFQVDMNTVADDFLPMVFPTEPNKRKRLGLPEECIIADYVLKVVGRISYIHGNFELIDFSQIVKAISKGRDVELVLVKRLDPTIDLPQHSPDWNLIDESTGLTGTHEELSALNKEHSQVFTMSMWDLHHKFRVRILGLDNLRDCIPDFDMIYVDVGMFHGGEELCKTLCTHEITASKYPRWNQWLVFNISVKNLPKTARLCFAVNGGIRRSDYRKRSSTWSKKDSAKQSTLRGDNIQTDRPLHWVNMQILDHRALLRQGVLRLNLWPYNTSSGDEGRWSGMSPVGSTAVNPNGNTAAVLYVELDTYLHPVACPTEGWGEDDVVHQTGQLHKENSPFRTHLDKSISSDPLANLDKVEKELLWKFRHQLTDSPEALPKFLQCVDWASLEQVTDTHKLIRQWTPITMEVALELLDYHFADEKVRTMAVMRLSKLTNDEVLVFLLQLVQVLKFEPYHDSALARFLLKKALQSKRIGHFFFWYLRSEMDSPQFSQRFGILLESFLKGCGKNMFNELQQQHQAVQDIMSVASGLKKHMEKHKGSVTDYVKDELSQREFPEQFAPPFDPGLRMGNLQIEKCRVMDSKKSPLWLEFMNMDSSVINQKPIKVIAKHGDDLRQDMLTLQMLTLMDSLWQSEGLDLYIIPYGCVATGNEMGMIEVVQDADTVAKIQLHHGGSFSTLKDEPLYEWLKKKNPNPKHFEKAIERFVYSCAGYCVATYVLGIGDRHNDNIMLTVTGNLFHIDFGHFLGNTKAFLGVNRDRAPFVLTPDFEYVLGRRTSETFKKFEEIAIKAYLIIRQNGNLFINLFSMMKCTGIPELRSVEDLDYLKSVLILGKNEEQAAEHFRQQIQKCLRLQWSTQLSWLAHNWVHR